MEKIETLGRSPGIIGRLGIPLVGVVLMACVALEVIAGYFGGCHSRVYSLVGVPCCFLTIGLITLLLFRCSELLKLKDRGRVLLMMGLVMVVHALVIRICSALYDQCMYSDYLRVQRCVLNDKVVFNHLPIYSYWCNYELLVSFMSKVLNRSIQSIQYVQALACVLAIPPLYSLSRRIAGSFTGMFASLVMGLSPSLVMYSKVLSGEFLGMVLFLYAFFFFVEFVDGGLKTGRAIFDLVLCGLFLGLSHLLKPIGALFLISVLVLSLFRVIFRCWRIRQAFLVVVFVFASYFGTVSLGRLAFSAVAEPQKIEHFDASVWNNLAIGLNVSAEGAFDKHLKQWLHGKSSSEIRNYLKRKVPAEWRQYPALIYKKFLRLYRDEWWGYGCFGQTISLNGAPGWARRFSAYWYVMSTMLFFLGAAGLLLRALTLEEDVLKGELTVLVLGGFTFAMMLFEVQGRYRMSVYPFYYLLIPYARIWFDVSHNRLYRVVAATDWWRRIGYAWDGFVGVMQRGVVRTMNKVGEEWRTHGCWLKTGLVLIFVIAIAVLTTRVGCDFRHHIRLAEGITLELLGRPVLFLKDYCYPMWHLLAAGIMGGTGCSGMTAASIISGVCIAVLWGCLVCLLSRLRPTVESWRVRLLGLLFFLAGPIYLPFYNEQVMVGQDSPNIWHNPTHLMVKVLAFPCLLLFARMIDRWRRAPLELTLRWWEFLGLSALLLLSCFAKPNFMQVFAPSVFLFCLWMLIRHGKGVFPSCMRVLGMFLPSIVLMMVQFMLVFFLTEHVPGVGVGIAPFKCWAMVSPSIIVSVGLVSAFPLLMAVYAVRTHTFGGLDILSWLAYLAGACEKALFIENGPRMMHCNFFWGYSMGCFFIWLAAFRQYAMMVTRERSFWRGVWTPWATLLLSAHLVSGSYYIWQLIFMGHRV